MISHVPKHTLALVRESVRVVIGNDSLHTLYGDVPTGTTEFASCDAEEVNALQNEEFWPCSTKVAECIQQLFNPMSFHTSLIERRHQPSCRFLQSADLK